jgi:hypothetical protein
MDQQKQPTGLFIAVILGLLACYGLGPACWLSSRFGGATVVTITYRPVTFVAEVSDSDGLMDAMQWYSQLGSSDFHVWSFSPDQPGHAQWSPFELPEWLWTGPIPSTPPPAAPSLTGDAEAQEPAVSVLNESTP